MPNLCTVIGTQLPIKRRIKCSHCNIVGHNKATCPEITDVDKAAAKEGKSKKRKVGDISNNSVESAVEEEDGSDCGSNADHMEEDQLGDDDIEEDDNAEVNEGEVKPIFVTIDEEKIETVVDLRHGNEKKALISDFPEFVLPYRYVSGPILPEDLEKSPAKYLELFWDDNIMSTFVLNTNAYALSNKDPKWRKDTTKDRLYVFFSIILHLGAVTVPERRSLWDTRSKYYSRFVHDIMSLDEFESILRNLHWNNSLQFTVAERNTKTREDCFWRVATLLEKLASSFKEHFRCGQDIDGDEQGIPCKGRHSAIQYNKDKPYKWFFKVYALNDAETAYMSNFYLFRGKDTARIQGVSASAYPIYYLTRPEMYHNKWHVCNIDNYFNSLPLLKLLYADKIHTNGTMRANRVKSTVSLYFDKKGVNKGNRGDMKCHKLCDNAYITSWVDKRSVNMLHSFPTNKNITTRASKDGNGKYVRTNVARPTVIQHYNKGMGGTDKFDQYMSYYRTSVKTKKWPHPVIFHFLHASIVNAWILYKTKYKLQKQDDCGNLISFIEHIINNWSVRGFIVPEAQVAHDILPKHRSTTTVDPADVRYFGQHFGRILKSDCRQMCKQPGCNRKASSICETCAVHLCMYSDEGSTCFEKYHTHKNAKC